MSDKSSIDTTGLVGYYPFCGNANDSSGHSNNGIVYGATLCADRFGNPNSAYSFNGTSDYILVPDAPNIEFTSALTISAWVNPMVCPQPEDGSPIVSKGNGSNESFSFDFKVDNGIRFQWWTSYQWMQCYLLEWLTSDMVNHWYHLVAVYDSASPICYLYENGIVIVAGSGTAANLNVNHHDLSIGSRQSGIAGYDFNFQGCLDDIRLFNRALTQGEIDTLFHEGGWTDVAGTASEVPQPIAVFAKASPNPATSHTNIEYQLPSR